ncbi:Alanine--tRNA ligase [Gurleya vavrai]
MECEIFCILYGNELIYKKGENVNEKIKDNDKSNDIYEKLNDINIEELNDIKELNYIKELKDSKELNDKLNDLKEFNNVKKPNDNLIDSKELNNIKSSNDSKELFTKNIDDNIDLNYSKKSDLSSNLIDENKIYAILCDKTCFYAECGGQIGDTGIIKIYSENILIGEMNVKDVKDFNGFILHFGTIKLLNFNLVNLKGKMIYNDRSDIMKNHTGTHLLNHTLRHFYGDVIQKGSFVDSLKLRFDFSYSKSFSKEEIKKIEDYMNDLINKKIKVKSLNFKFNEIPKDCIYMKDEKYPDEVRIISIENVSKELCGGTHVKNLSEIKSIRIMSEGSISSNTRRIVCFTGENAIKASKGELHELPLIEKIENAEKLKEEEKRILLHKKEIINGNMLKITNLINDYKKEIKNNYFFKVENNKLKHYILENKLEDICKFIYEVNFEDLKLKNISKELNGIANILDKEKINGCIFYIEDDFLYFNFRGLNAIERCKKFCEKLVETNIGGNENCASGKGKFKIKN